MINPYKYREQARKNIEGVGNTAHSFSTNNVVSKQIQATEDTKQDNGYTFGATTLNIVKNILQGATKSLEGIVDAGAMLTGIFGNEDYKKKVEEMVKYDWTSDVFGTDGEGQGKYDFDWGSKLEDKSSLKNDNFVNEVASGVGGMLPAIAVNFIPVVGQALSSAVFITGASGQGSEEALKEGGSYGQALGYGALSGAIEGGTEMIGGRVFGGSSELSKTLFGKALIKSGNASLVRNGIGKFAYNFVSEGAEEVLSDILSPIAKKVTGLSEDVDIDWKSMPKTFFVGGATASVLEPFQSSMVAIANKKNGGSHYVKVGENLSTISDVIAGQDYIQQNAKLSNEQIKAVNSKSSKAILTSVENISTELKAMNEEQRANCLSEMSSVVSDMFESNGEVKADTINSLNDAINGNIVNQSAELGLQQSKIKETLQGAENQLNGGMETAMAMSQNEAEQVLQNEETRLNQEGNQVKFELDNSTLNETENTNFANVLKSVESVNKVAGSNLKVVIYKESNNNGKNRTNAFIKDGVLFLTKEHITNGDWSSYVAHEITHFTEGSKNFNDYAKFILSDENKSLLEEAKEEVAKSGYDGVNNETIESAINKVNNNEKLTKEESLAYSEVVAKMSEKMFDNEDSIRRLARSNKGLFNKIRNALHDLVEAIKGTKNYDKYAKAEKLFNKVLEGIKEETKEVAKISEKAIKDYKKDKKIYESLAESEKEQWLKDNHYQAEDFNDDVLDNDAQFNLATWEDQTILTYDKDGEAVAKSGKEILTETLNELNWTKKDIDKLVNDVDSVASVYKELAKEYKILNDFKDIKPHYRTDGSLMLSCLISNGEYELNIDFSTICKKREMLSRFLTEFTENGNKFGDGGFTKPKQAYLENLFKKYGLDTACTFCFVEARRKNVDTWSEKLVTLWNEGLNRANIDAKKLPRITEMDALKGIDTIFGISDDYAFNVANIMESDALQSMEVNSIQAYEDYKNERIEENKAQGKGKPRANTEERILEYIKNKVNSQNQELFRFEVEDFLNVKVITYLKANYPQFYSIMLTSYGANAPKQTLPATPYTSNVLIDKEFNKKNITPEYVLSIGGVRLNSFNDFQITRVLDYVQFVADLTAKGYSAHTYTKELAQVELLGKSGIKQNMSLIPEVDLSIDKDHAGLDADGNYILSTDSVDYKKAFELQEKEGYKGDAGTVLVGISKYQILKALDDDRIKMVLPYHSSGMPKHLKIYFNHTYYTDYQQYQTTKAISKKTNSAILDEESESGIRGTKNLKKDPFNRIFYKSYHKSNGNYLKATQDYLDYCREKNLVPRFAMVWDTSLTGTEGWDANFNNPNNYILNHPNYYKVLIDFTSDGGIDAKGNRIFKEQGAVKLNLDGIDVKGIVEREVKAYEKSLETYNSVKDNMLKDFVKAINGDLSDTEIKRIRDERIAKENKENVVKDVKFSLNEDANTIKSKAQLKEKLSQAENYWKDKFNSERKANQENLAKEKSYRNVYGEIWKTIGEIRGWTGYGANQKKGFATILKDGYMRNLVDGVSKITYGGKIDSKKVREVMSNLRTFINPANTRLQEYFKERYGNMIDMNNVEYLSNEVDNNNGNAMFQQLLDALSVIRENKPDVNVMLTTEELVATNTVLKMIKAYATHYNSIYEDGKKIDRTEYASRMGTIAETSANSHLVNKNKLFGYEALVTTPDVVFNMLDCYQKDGFLTHYYERFHRDSINMAYDRLQMMTKMDDFLKANKGYAKRLTNEKTAVGNYEMTIGQAIDLYLMATQENGLLTLTDGAGFYIDQDGKSVECGQVTKEQIDAIADNFSDTDKEFIKLLKEVYKDGGENYKRPTDIDRYGYTNIIQGEYYTITRHKDGIARASSDIRSQLNDVALANNLSYNKKRSKNAIKVALSVTNCYDKLNRYVNAMTLYKNMSQDLENFDKIFNQQIPSKNGTKLLRAIYNDYIWKDTSKYVEDLLADIQGIGILSDNVSNKMSQLYNKIRSNYAKAQLGFNPKVCLTQVASYPTAFAVLDAKSLFKAFNIKTFKDIGEMDKYCKSAYIRNYSQEIVKAEGLLDKVSDIGDKMTKGIQYTDRFTIGRLWYACQYEIESSKNLAFGTEENKVEAGKLLDEVITKTQPTYNAIDRSALMRSKNQILKSLTMFTSVPLKQISLLIDSVNYKRALKLRAKNGESISQAEISQANKGIAKSLTANVCANMMYATLVQLVKHIFNKDDEEDNDGQSTMEQILSQFGDTTIGMFPIIKDLYNMFIKKFESNTFELSMVNDIASATTSLYDAIVDGDETKTARKVRDLLFNVGLGVGIPLRNIYNTTYGLINRFDTSTAYNINSVFYNPSTSDLDKALKKGDTDLASTITRQLMAFKGQDISKEQASILSELYGEGYSLPSGIPDSITVDGETKTLTNAQKSKFSDVYSKASDVADKILSDGTFNGKSSEIKSKALSYLYKYYYYEARVSIGIEEDSKLYMFGQLIDISKMATILAEVPSLVEGRSNKKTIIQKYLNRQKLTSAQKYALMGYFGYSNTNGESSVKALINKTNLTKAQKETLLEKCGYSK